MLSALQDLIVLQHQNYTTRVLAAGGQVLIELLDLPVYEIPDYTSNRRGCSHAQRPTFLPNSGGYSGR